VDMEAKNAEYKNSKRSTFSVTQINTLDQQAFPS